MADHPHTLNNQLKINLATLQLQKKIHGNLKMHIAKKFKIKGRHRIFDELSVRNNVNFLQSIIIRRDKVRSLKKDLQKIKFDKFDSLKELSHELITKRKASRCQHEVSGHHDHLYIRERLQELMDLDIYLDCMKNHSKYYANKILDDLPQGMDDDCCEYIDINGTFNPNKYDSDGSDEEE